MKITKREEPYLYWLHNIPELSEKAAVLLLENCESPSQIYRMSRQELKEKLISWGWRDKVAERKAEAFEQFRKEWRLEQAFEELQKKQIRMITVFHREYPRRLFAMASPPMALYCIGELPKERDCTVAVIGARDCSEYGSYAAGAFGERLGRAGIRVVSGMARGIDGIAQKAALDGGGRTYAVLGCGVDVCYPASQKELYGRIREQGGVISPFVPGTPPKKQLFPYRNSIVAGLSDAVLVIEARQKSGTFITVDMALEQGKDVYAVPGRLTDRLSDGCNLLIRQGSGVVLSPEDLIAELVMLKNRENGGDRENVGNRENTGSRGNTGGGTLGGQKEISGWQRKVSPEELQARRRLCDRTEGLQKKRRQTEQDKQISGQMSLELSAEDGILGLLDLEPKSADALYEAAGKRGMQMTMQELLADLIELCMEGKARQVSGNWFARAVAYSD